MRFVIFSGTKFSDKRESETDSIKGTKTKTKTKTKKETLLPREPSSKQPKLEEKAKSDFLVS